VQQPAPKRLGYRRRPVLGAELAEDPFEMAFDGVG
jgi:hypothetical protein